MNEHVRNLLQLYENTLANRGIPRLYAPEGAGLTSAQRLGHVRWLIDTHLHPTDPVTATKAKNPAYGAYLVGLAQGVLGAEGVFSFDTLLEQGTPILSVGAPALTVDAR